MEHQGHLYEKEIKLRLSQLSKLTLIVIFLTHFVITITNRIKKMGHTGGIRSPSLLLTPFSYQLLDQIAGRPSRAVPVPNEGEVINKSCL
ncbi:hypothetical protein ACE1TI_00630 [Alteribacillus sp. JSM 102045]|uniref:hypothetical protein n=1 Tax=Alteribacillus sp. JSM 102045 TaxID=1562101 RepID=UPI0035C1D56A